MCFSEFGCDVSNVHSSLTPVAMLADDTVSVIEFAKRDVEKSRKALLSRQNSAINWWVFVNGIYILCHPEMCFVPKRLTCKLDR